MMDIRKALTGMNVEKFARQGARFVKNNLPTILSVTALGCYSLAIVEAIKATHKSDVDVAKEEERRATELPLYENTELSNKEKFDLCWTNYVKSALLWGAGTALLISSECKHNEKYLAVMGAYELTRKANEEREAVELDILGEDKAKEIDKAVKQRMAKDVVIPTDGIQSTKSENDNKTLFLEPYTNTPFYATDEEVLHAFNYVNYKRHKDGVASINDLLKDLGLRQMAVANDWGWNENQELVEPVLDDARLVDDDPAMPATLIDYSIEPQFDFGNDKSQWRDDIPWRG